MVVVLSLDWGLHGDYHKDLCVHSLLTISKSWV